MKNFKSKIFPVICVALAASLLIISLQYKSKTEALTAIVESQETAITYSKPVIVQSVHVIPGQEVRSGDTLVIVSRPDLDLDLERKQYESNLVKAKMETSESNKNSKVQLLSIERDSKINRLSTEINEIRTKLYQQGVIRKNLSEASVQNATDSLRLIQYKALTTEIVDVKRYYGKEIQREIQQCEQEQAAYVKELDLILKETEVLEQERDQLIKIAQFEGIVATAEIQLDELVPPYKKLVTIYEAQPSLIKAYMNERFSTPLEPGDTVKVVSENRLYSVPGTVKELGARITSYPVQIQSQITNVTFYGQEVFISIPRENRFLNGEKVFVYPQTTGVTP